MQALLDELIDRLEEKLSRAPQEAASIHAVFGENGAHKLYRASLSCHLPKHVVAAHEEDHDAGRAIRKAFAELERQLDKLRALASHERIRQRRHQKGTMPLVFLVSVLTLSTVHGPRSTDVMGWAETSEGASPSPEALAALRLIESEDAYQRRLGFLQLEALREPATASLIARYAAHPKAEWRALGLRALAAIQGLAAADRLLEALKRDPDPVVRWSVLQGLEPFWQAHPAILPAAIRAMRDRSTEVRITAVDVVSRINDPKAKEALKARDLRERRDDVRRVLGPALKRAGIDTPRDARLTR